MAEDRGSGGPAVPDYELEDTLEVTDPAGLKAVGHRMRGRLLRLLSERAATTSELAEALEEPKGTVGYHLKVLESVGLVRIVRTEQVRAITAKYYGRTARTFIFGGLDDARLDPFFMIRDALAEMRPGEPSMSTLRHARIPRDRAEEWVRRLADLAEEFVTQTPDGSETFGLLLALYPTDWKTLPATGGRDDG